MPLKVSVGLNRKVGEPNYGSRGVNVNLEMELDQALLNEPQQLQTRIRQLFGMLRTTLAQELEGGNGAAKSSEARPQVRNGNHPNNGADTSRASARPATPSQVKAIYAIGRSQGVDLPHLLHERFQVTRADDLTVPEASRLIDELKGGAGQDRQ